MLTIHATGDWDEERVHAEWLGHSSRPVIPEVEAAIEAAWADVLRRPGVHLFDGPMCRLERWDASSDALRLWLSPTSYKPFLGTNLSNPHLADRHGPAALANPVGVSVALETADEFLLLGRRTETVAYYPGRVHPFAGALEPKDGVRVFDAVRRELAEELAFAADDVEAVRCTGLVEDRALRQPELIFRVRSGRTRQQVEAKLDRVEHHGTYAVRADRGGVEGAMGDALLTPVAVASLLLWGRVRFGAAWFGEVARAATG